MLIFNLTIHHLWGRVIAKYSQVRALPYGAVVDDAVRYIEHSLLRDALGEDGGLGDVEVKSSILLEDVLELSHDLQGHSQIGLHITVLTPLNVDVSLTSFCPEGFIGIGVPIGTDAFVRNFVAKTCRDIIDDVEKLDAIQDDFIHYQLLRFCQATRLQYINSHILIGNRFVLQQQHVDCKIADALLKKGTKENTEMVGTCLPGHTM
jgi:hypothetical protein